MTTTEKVDYIFKAIERSGMSISDIQRVTSVSRTTLYAWKNGGNAVDTIRLGIMVRVASNLNIACDAGTLPLKNPLKTEERVRLLRKIIATAATKRVE